MDFYYTGSLPYQHTNSWQMSMPAPRGQLMPQAADKSALMGCHYVTLILRLTLDQTGSLLQGHLVDTVNQHPKAFVGTEGLYQTVEAWLQQQHSTGTQKP